MNEINPTATSPGPVPAPEPPEPPEPAIAEPKRSWVVAYGRLGLINIVADSQDELVKRINGMRSTVHDTLQTVEVVSNRLAAETSRVWINPNLVEAVLNEHEPQAEQAGMSPGLPPGLQALLEAAGGAQPSDAETAVEVVVVAEPGDPGSEG